MTKLFIDTEFNGYQGELLSLALVTEDANVGLNVDNVIERLNATVYNVEFPLPAQIDPWVAANVVPNLSPIKYPLEYAQNSLRVFLKQFDQIHVIADWPDDIRYFMELLITGPGTRIDTPPMTLEVRRDIDSSASKVPHNAFWDALALRDAYLAVTKTQN